MAGFARDVLEGAGVVLCAIRQRRGAIAVTPPPEFKPSPPAARVATQGAVAATREADSDAVLEPERDVTRDGGSWGQQVEIGHGRLASQQSFRRAQMRAGDDPHRLNNTAAWSEVKTRCNTLRETAPCGSVCERESLVCEIEESNSDEAGAGLRHRSRELAYAGVR